MKIARISKGIFGKSQCNTEMSTVIPINLKRVVKGASEAKPEAKEKKSKALMKRDL